MPTNFGSALRSARNKAGKNLAELAEALGFSKSYVSDVERGLRAPFDPDTIVVAAKTCGAEVDELIAAAARDRGFLDLPIRDDVSNDLLAALVRMRKGLKSNKPQIRRLRELLR